MVVIIIAGFMPLSAFSFFKSMLPKKEKDYKKAMDDMGINTEKQVRDVYTPIRYLLPVSFITIICLLGAGLIAFTDSFAGELGDSLILTGAFFGEANTDSTKFGSRNLCFFRKFYLVFVCGHRSIIF